MKKTLLVLISILLLWLGATAWIGAQVAPEAQRYAAWLSERYAPPGYRFEANVTERGLLRSTVRLALAETSGGAKHPPMPAVTAEVTHGPVWFSKGLGAGLARIETQQRYRDYREILRRNHLAIEPENGAVHTVARIGFDGRVHARSRADAFVLKDLREPTQLVVDPAVFSGEWEPYTLIGNYRAHTASVKGLKSPGEPLFAIEDLHSTAHIDARLSTWVYTGGGSVQAARMRLYDEQNRPIDLLPRLTFAITPEANRTVGITYRADLELLSGSQLPLKALHTETTLHGIARNGLERLLEKLRTWQREQVRLERELAASVHRPEQLSKAMIAMQEWQKEVAREGQTALAELPVPGQTALQLRWRLETGHAPYNELNATLRLLDTLPQGDGARRLEMLKRDVLDYIELDLSATFGTRLTEDLGSSGRLWITWINLGRSQGYLTCSAGQCRGGLLYRPDRLTINGRSMPKLLWMIKMMRIGGFF